MPNIYMLDTNVITEITKPEPNSSVLKKLSENSKFCAICSTVWQESVQGYNLLPEGKRKNIIGECLEKIRENYTILPYDSFASQICGELRSKCEKAGNPVPAFDSQIAATTIANGMILITRNTADFAAMCENSMLRVEDWWEE